MNALDYGCHVVWYPTGGIWILPFKLPLESVELLEWQQKTTSEKLYMRTVLFSD